MSVYRIYTKRTHDIGFTLYGQYASEFLAMRGAWEAINMDESIVAVRLNTPNGDSLIYDVTVVVS